MAEQNNNIQYLNYGDNQRVAQSDFMEKAANEVNNYVNSRPWSNKKKQKFMEAYSNIMSYGVSGASVKNGQWVVDINTNFDINTLPEADQKMYKEAAYFIQQQMSGMASDVEQKKEGTKPFDNTAFVEGLHKHIKNKMFGGMDWNIGGPNDDWNKLDPRDSKGVRGRKERAKTLANYLSSYADTIDENTYSFEDSPFKDYKDFKARIQNAITALRTDTIDDDESALNQLGLRASNYFNNGSGDPFEQGDYSGTYGDYYNRYLPEQLKKRQELEGQKEKALQKALEQKKQAVGQNYTMTTRVGPGALPTTRQLADKYGSTEGLLNQITEYGNRGLDKLTPEETKELVAAFRYGATASLTDDEFNLLKTSPSYKGASKSRFRKFPNISNLFLDTATGQVINIYDQATKDARGSDFLAGQDSKSQQEQYLQNTEFTNADWAELGGIVGDIVSILDPEPFSAAAAGVAAAGARNYARTRGPESWGFLDYLSQGADYLTGAIGGITGIGDALLAGKVAKNVVPWLRRAMRVPAFLDLWNSTPELIPIGQKLFSGQDLTVQDWMNLGTFFRGLATTRNLNVSNRASRKAMQERGYQVSNRIDKRIGLTSSKPITESGSPTVRMTINGKQEEIPISAETKAKLDKQLSKAGNNIESRSKIVRENAEVQAAAEKAGIKVKEKTTDADGKVTEKISDNWNNSKVVYNESLRNARLFKNKLGLTPSWTRTSGGTFGESSSSVGRTFDNFENYLNSNRSLLDRFTYGSNQTLRGMDRFNAFQHGTTPVTNIHEIQYTGEIDENVLRELNNAFNPSNKKLRSASRVINPKNSSANGKLIDGSDYQVKFGKDSSGKDEMLLIINGNSQKVKGNSLNEMKQNLGKMIREQNVKLQQNNKIILNNNDPKWQDFVKSIKDLKRKGYLFSHGGRIDRQKMQQYKEFIKR